MIVVRDVFEIYPDRVGDAESILRALDSQLSRVGMGEGRVMIERLDVYAWQPRSEPRFIIEREFDSVDAFTRSKEIGRNDESCSQAWRACKGLVSTIRREIYEVTPQSR